MKKRKQKFAIFFLLLVILPAFFFTWQKIKNLNFFQQKERKIEEVEEPKSAAIYCQVRKLSGAPVVSDAKAVLATTTVSSANFLIKEEQIVDKCVHIDENGAAFKEAPIISGGPFLVIYDKRERELEMNKQIIRPEILKSILEIKQKISLTLLNFTIISPISADLEVLTSGGWKIYFDAAKDINKQINALNKILDQEIKPKEYIDLRIDNRAYWK